MRPRPIFELVVIAEIDLAQTIRLGRALVVIRPAGESLLRRAAIAAAGIADERVARQRRSRGSKLQRPDIGAGGRIIGACYTRPEDQQRRCGQSALHNKMLVQTSAQTRTDDLLTRSRPGLTRPRTSTRRPWTAFVGAPHKAGHERLDGDCIV